MNMLRIVFGFVVSCFLFVGCETFQLDGFKATDGESEVSLEHVEGSTEK